MDAEPSSREDLLARLAPSGAEDFITEAFCCCSHGAASATASFIA